MAKRRARGSVVIDLGAARARRRMAEYREKIARVLESNRRAIGRLYTSGAMFSRQGARAGRDLLLAHEHLLRVMALITRLSERGDSAGPRNPEQVNAVYAELEELLERTSDLTVKTGTYLSRLRGE